MKKEKQKDRKMSKTKEKTPFTAIEKSCPECGGSIHDGTGTGWEVCRNPKCLWIG